MTNSNKAISTKTYDPKKSTNVWNSNTPSTRKTKRANQQTKKMAAYLTFLFFNLTMPLLNQSAYDKYFDRMAFGSFDAMS